MVLQSSQPFSEVPSTAVRFATVRQGLIRFGGDRCSIAHVG